MKIDVSSHNLSRFLGRVLRSRPRIKLPGRFLYSARLNLGSCYYFRPLRQPHVCEMFVVIHDKLSVSRRAGLGVTVQLISAGRQHRRIETMPEIPREVVTLFDDTRLTRRFTRSRRAALTVLRFPCWPARRLSCESAVTAIDG